MYDHGTDSLFPARRPAMAMSELDERVAAVRRFNRFYTRQIGLLQDGYLDSAASLSRDLGLDPGYLSRVLRDFETRRFITRTRSEDDGRQSHLELTARGQAAFAPLEQRSHREIGGIVGRLSVPEQI